MAFSEVLKELRTDKALTHLQLGEKIGFSRSIIGLWESGKRLPTADALISLANFFNVTTDYLLGVSDDYRPAASASSVATNSPNLSPAQRIVIDQILDLPENELPLVSVFIDGVVAKRTAGNGNAQKFGKK